MLRIAINGFGRIGRNFLRALLTDKDCCKQIEVVAINIGPAPSCDVALMFKYDTLMGTYPGNVRTADDVLLVDDHKIKVLAELDPRKINWKSLNVDWVVESSGCFTDCEQAMWHIEGGAKKVLISAPAKDEDVTIIPGVNDDKYDASNHKVVSLGSCSTNAFVPLAKVMDDAFGIDKGFITSIHAYTNSQRLLDVNDTDVRRCRAAALNIIPTTTGALKVFDRVMPKLAGRMQGRAVRVPVAVVSLLDFVFQAKQKISVETIHAACRDAEVGALKGILGLSMEPLVSSDYSGDSRSVVVDGLLTEAIDNMGHLYGWYDNEWAYSVRLKDFLLSTI